MLQFQILQPSEVSWQPQRHVPQADLSTAKPLTFEELQKTLGWQPRISRRSDAVVRETIWLPATQTYFADFGPAAQTRCQLGVGGQYFDVIEQPVLAVYEPFTFIYPSSVSTTRMELSDGVALVVIPPPGGQAAAFAVWTRDDRLIKIIFNWQTSVEEASEILQSVVPTT